MNKIFATLLTLFFFLSGPTTEGKTVYRRSALAAMTDSRYGNSATSSAISGPWADSNPFRFSSQYYHAPSGLHGYACRFYDPGLQRWLTPDPLGDMGGVNPYQFNYGNPVTYADPDGRTPLVTGAIGAGIGAIVGGGIAWWQGGSSSDIIKFLCLERGNTGWLRNSRCFSFPTELIP